VSGNVTKSIRLDQATLKRVRKYMRDVFVSRGITLTEAAAIRALTVQALNEHDEVTKRGAQ
jgi:hypothetical protein